MSIKLYCQICGQYTAYMALKAKPGTEHNIVVVCPDCTHKDKTSADIPDFFKDIFKQHFGV